VRETAQNDDQGWRQDPEQCSIDKMRMVASQFSQKLSGGAAVCTAAALSMFGCGLEYKP
jgi:hypothetical protein